MKRPARALHVSRASCVGSWVVALVVLLLSTPSAAQVVDAGPEDLLARTRDAIEAQNFEQAWRLSDGLAHSKDARIAAQGLFLRGVVHEGRHDLPSALTDYRTSLAREPGSPVALRAQARIDFLSARPEGDMSPLAALEQMRGDARALKDPVQLETFVARAHTFPTGLVRTESLLMAAQAFDRADRLSRGGELLREVASDTRAPEDQRKYATELLSLVNPETELLRTSSAELERLGASEEQISRVKRIERRMVLGRLAWWSLAVVLLAGVTSVAVVLTQSRRKALWRVCSRPLPLVHIGMFSLGGALIVRSGQSHDIRPFLALGGGTLGVYLCASAWTLVGSDHPAMRVVRVIVCSAGALGVAFLSMRYYDPMMLDGIAL